MLNAVALLLLIFGATQDTGINVTRSPGGTMRTPLGFGIALNEKSTVQREWITVRNPVLPADFTGAAGVGISYEDRNSVYISSYGLEVKQPVSAVEVRFLVFDLWGNHVRTEHD